MTLRIDLENKKLLYAKTLIVFLLLSVFMLRVIDNSSYRAESDDIGLYIATLSVVEPEAYQEQRPYLIESTEYTDKYSTEYIKFVHVFRENFKENYSAILVSLAAYRALYLTKEIDSLPEYIEYTSQAHVFVHFTFLGLCVLLLIYVIMRSDKMSFLVPIGVLLALNVLFSLAPMGIWRIGMDFGIISIMMRGFHFITFTYNGFDIFDASPRSISTLLLFIAFLLRFDNRHNVGYWILCISLVFHTLYALLGICVCLLLDAAFRPKYIQKNKTIIFTTCITSLAVLATSGIWSSTGSSAAYFPYCVLAVLGISQMSRFLEFFRRVFRVDTWCQGNTLYAEFLCIWMMIFASWIISYIAFLIYHLDMLQVFSSAEIAPRITGLFRYVALFSCAHYLYQKYQKLTLSSDMKYFLRLSACLSIIAIFSISALISYYKLLANNHKNNRLYDQVYLRCIEEGVLDKASLFAACKIDGVCHEPWNEVCPFKDMKI